MDVRFYPAAAGSSLPGDPSNLDFAQCLGYYNYNKVIIPACVIIARAAARAGSPRAGVRAPSGRGGAGLGDARGGGARPPVPAGPWDARPREGGGAGSSRAGRPAPPPSRRGGGPAGQAAASLARCLGVSVPSESQAGPRVTSGCGSLSPRPRTKGGFPERSLRGSGRDLLNFSPGWSRCGSPGGRGAPRRGSGVPAREGRGRLPLLCSFG